MDGTFIGATDRYVRLPFLIEGAAEAALAMGIALAILSVVMGRLEIAFGDVLPLIGAGSLQRLSGGAMLMLLVGGCAAGAAGAALTLRRLEEV